MLFTHTLTVPANTSEGAAVSDKLELDHGVITRVEVEFPAGCAGLVYVHIDRALHQVWPTNPDGRLRSDGRAIVWADYQEMFAEPLELDLVGYNLDDTYQHQVLFRFELTPRAIAERGLETISFVHKLRKAFTR